MKLVSTMSQPCRPGLGLLALGRGFRDEAPRGTRHLRLAKHT